MTSAAAGARGGGHGLALTAAVRDACCLQVRLLEQSEALPLNLRPEGARLKLQARLHALEKDWGSEYVCRQLRAAIGSDDYVTVHCTLRAFRGYLQRRAAQAAAVLPAAAAAAAEATPAVVARSAQAARESGEEQVLHESLQRRQEALLHSRRNRLQELAKVAQPGIMDLLLARHATPPSVRQSSRARLPRSCTARVASSSSSCVTRGPISMPPGAPG